MPRSHWQTSKELVHIGKGRVNIKPWSNGLCPTTAIRLEITAQEVLFLFACINEYLQYLFCYTGKSLKNFEPVYPMKLKIDLQTFCHAFPFHVVFDEQVKFTEIYT